MAANMRNVRELLIEPIALGVTIILLILMGIYGIVAIALYGEGDCAVVNYGLDVSPVESRPSAWYWMRTPAKLTVETGRVDYVWEIGRWVPLDVPPERYLGTCESTYWRTMGAFADALNGEEVELDDGLAGYARMIRRFQCQHTCTET